MIAIVLLDRLLASGLGFVFDKVAQAVDAERDDEATLKEDLLALQMALESGEVDDEEYSEREGEILARLREVRERRTGASAGAVSFGGGGGGDVNVGSIEIEVGWRGDEDSGSGSAADRDRRGGG